MSNVINRGTTWAVMSIAVVGLSFGFTPISRLLLRLVNGSFDPTPYSSLALSNLNLTEVGLVVGKPVSVQLGNHTGHKRTYYWSATQNGTLISLGEETLNNGFSTKVSVPTRGATTGILKISLKGTSIFVTVPVVAS